MCVLTDHAMKKLLSIALLLAGALSLWAREGSRTIDLAGEWEFAKDHNSCGTASGWAAGGFSDSIMLPGAIHAQGKGDPVGPWTEWYSGNLTDVWYTHPMYKKYRQADNFKIFSFLQPLTYYVGPAWYSRTVEVPAGFAGKHLTLSLERVHWESTLYVNGVEVGRNRSLGTAQVYDVSDVVVPGRTNRITLRIDNSKVVDTGRIPHSTSDQTMAAWNGVIGEMTLSARDRVWIEDVQVYPDVENRQIRVKATIGGSPARKAVLSCALECYNTPSPYSEKPFSVRTALNEGSTEVEFTRALDGRMQTWDEFSPALYRLDLRLSAGGSSDSRSVSFGMRNVVKKDNAIILNGTRRFLRGNLYCGESPLDGLPPMDEAYWRKIFQRHLDYGHNAVRFHSWCPPEVAFRVADEMGIYLQPEVGEWVKYVTDEQEEYLLGEAERIRRFYANHPSFLLFALGNELTADTVRLQRFVEIQKKDGRFLAGAKTNGRPDIPEAEFYSTHSIKGKGMRHHVGWPPAPKTNLIIRQRPTTDYDYTGALEGYDKIFLSHEIGQCCVYPDYQTELPKYTGSLRSGSMEIQRDQMEERGMTDLARTFTETAGEWQMRLLKAEYEALLRTRGLDGFWSLSLQDFTGQGTAPVGVMDAFWDDKCYACPEEFRHFCDTTVLLARIPSLVMSSSDCFSAAMEVFHYGSRPLPEGTVRYEVASSDGRVLHTGTLGTPLIANAGDNAGIGSIALPEPLPVGKYELRACLDGTPVSNSWEFWVFPSRARAAEMAAEAAGTFAASPETAASISVLRTREMTPEVLDFLQAGGTVLWEVDHTKLKGHLPIAFGTFYWTTFGMAAGESMCNSILLDPAHPLFRGFPTNSFTDWQWWDVLKHSRPMILSDFNARAPFPAGFQPIIRAIDSWRINRLLALLAECRVGEGRLMISSIDFSYDMASRPVTCTLLGCLVRYMNSAEFRPAVSVSPDQVLSIVGPEDNVPTPRAVTSGVLPTEG